jgi:NAD+ synthase
VIDSIIEAKPTDGLHSNGATDEDQIGATYDELERAMKEYDDGKIADSFPKGSRENEVMSIYQTRHEINAHKMQMPEIATLPL